MKTVVFGDLCQTAILIVDANPNKELLDLKEVNLRHLLSSSEQQWTPLPSDNWGSLWILFSFPRTCRLDHTLRSTLDQLPLSMTLTTHTTLPNPPTVCPILISGYDCCWKHFCAETCFAVMSLLNFPKLPQRRVSKITPVFATVQLWTWVLTAWDLWKLSDHEMATLSKLEFLFFRGFSGRVKISFQNYSIKGSEKQWLLHSDLVASDRVSFPFASWTQHE